MIYLDQAATSSPKAPGVPETVMRHLGAGMANANRASHDGAVAASSVLFETRKLAAQLLGAGDSARVIFTSGATLSLNMVILGVLRPGDRVLVSPLEHNSVMRPLQRLARRDGIVIERFACAPDGSINYDDYLGKLAARPRLVVSTAVSNVTGGLMPWAEMALAAHAVGALFCLDAAQALGTLPLAVADGPVDFLCASGHKGLLAPPGTGLLYVAPGIDLEAVICGGTGSQSSSEEQPDAYPDRLESGTQNIAGLAGLKVALEFIREMGVTRISRHIAGLTALARKKLRALPGVTVHGPADAHGIVSFTHNRLSPSDITRELDRQGIAVRCGLHCAPAAHQALGTYPGGTVRLSFGYFTGESEVLKAIKTIRTILHE